MTLVDDRLSGERIAARWQRVKERVGVAARRSGRAVEDIRIIGVTKYVDAQGAQRLVDAGCRDLGEARPQQLWQKYQVIGHSVGGSQTLSTELSPVRWHLIGPLQRNKVSRTVATGCLIHSVDSEALLEAISKSQNALVPHKPLEVLLEVKVAADAEKHGLDPGQVQRVLESASRFTGVRPCGLMTMASRVGGASQARRDFASLRQLFERLVPSFPQLKELSMGMSGDFEEAVLEGATMVRIGTLLWEDAPG